MIVSSREASLVAIVARDGSIVWQMGPDYSSSPELRAIRQIIGQHNAHFIPKGLPGAGNFMVFDNGGASGYGRPTSLALNGAGIFARPTSRVLEIDPVTLKLVWSYTAPAFFATNISGAQRLPNGNTMVTEGPDGRVFEVTREGTIVWEYVFPLFSGAEERGRPTPFTGPTGCRTSGSRSSGVRWRRRSLLRRLASSGCRDRAPELRADSGLPCYYQVRRLNPPTKSKWVSRLITGIACCRLSAAIQTSLAGIGLPAPLSSSRMAV